MPWLHTLVQFPGLISSESGWWDRCHSAFCFGLEPVSFIHPLLRAYVDQSSAILCGCTRPRYDASARLHLQLTRHIDRARTYTGVHLVHIAGCCPRDTIRGPRPPLIICRPLSRTIWPSTWRELVHMHMHVNQRSEQARQSTSFDTRVNSATAIATSRLHQ